MEVFNAKDRHFDKIQSDFSFLTHYGFYVRHEPLDDDFYRTESLLISNLNNDQRKEYIQRLAKTIYFIKNSNGVVLIDF